MIKANELRIGNLVNIGYDCNVVRIDEYGATLNTHKGVKDLLYFHQTDIRPIPLTEEWLLKLGFEYKYHVKGGRDSFDFGSFLISKYKDEFELGFYDSEYGIGEFTVKVNTVHHLQNLYFALTSEELKVKNGY